MSIVGFSFMKINAERKASVIGQININNNIQLKELQEAKLGLGGDRGALRISFLFSSTYAPNVALLSMEGEVLVLVDAKQQASMLENWKKSKQLPRELAEMVMNHILDRCNIQALLLAKDLNLPSPVPLPKVQVNMPPAQTKEAPKPDAPMKTTKIGKKK